MTSIIFLIVAVLLIILASVLTSVESAVTGLSRARVLELVKSDENQAARRLLPVVDNRARHINLLVLLRTLCETSAAVLVTVIAVSWVDDMSWAVVAAILSLTLVTYVVVGVISRTMGRQNPHTIAIRAAAVLTTLAWFLGPIARLLINLGNLLTPGQKFRDGPFATEVELRELVDIASQRGVVDMDERRMIQAVFDLAETRARQVMVPRPDMLWIEKDKNAVQATRLCIRSGHSRIPVIADGIDDICGVVYLKDLVAHTYEGTDIGQDIPVTELMRPAEFVPDTICLDVLLQQMQSTHTHIAMLVDEYGGIAGLISIEDILEEIVGEIADEYDEGEDAPISALGQGSYRLQARVTLDEVVELFDEEENITIEFSDEQRDEVETIAGLLAYELGRVPLPGSRVTTNGLALRCEGGRDRRGRLKVRSVIVTADPESLNSDDRNVHAEESAEK